MNQVGVTKRPEIPIKEFAEAMEHEPELVLPYDPQLFGTAANNGQMVAELKPDAKATQNMLELAKDLVGREAKTIKRTAVKKFWEQLMGRD